jgi:hypothetical protein
MWRIILTVLREVLQDRQNSPFDRQSAAQLIQNIEDQTKALETVLTDILEERPHSLRVAARKAIHAIRAGGSTSRPA